LGALLVYRLGAYIPLPGIDASHDLISGPGIRRVAIFSFNVLPYVLAAILVQLALLISGRLRVMRKRGARGRTVIEGWTLYLTILLAALQSFGLAYAYMSVPGLVAIPGWLFVITTIATLTGGTMFLVWLSAQITARGVGNGLALILIVGALTQIPATVAGALELGRQGVISQGGLLGLALMVVVVVGFVVLMERGRRHIPIRYPQRQVGAVMVAERTAPLSLKLNNAGMLPFFFAPWPLLALVALGKLGSPALADMATRLEVGHPLYLVLEALLTVFLAFLYTAFVLDPDDGAGSLRQLGGAIAGVEPGDATAAHIDRVASRITAIGGVYLAAVCLLPDILVFATGLPFYFGGPTLLLVVCTMLDLAAELRAYGGAPSRP
jgi:preprotein translocase subunit SecY